MELTYDKLYDFTENNINKALKKFKLREAKESLHIDFPGYEDILPGDYTEGNFVTLFLDIRNSTKRAFDIGAKKTFVTIQGLLPTLAYIVHDLGGFIVDYPGDGIMAHWVIGTPSQTAIKAAINAAGWMDDSVNNIINKLLEKNGIPSITCGIGIASGEVIITKLGIDGYYSAKAIGNSVNFAAKLASDKDNNGAILVNEHIAKIAVSEFKVQSSIIDKDVVLIKPNEQLMMPRENKSVELLKKFTLLLRED